MTSPRPRRGLDARIILGRGDTFSLDLDLSIEPGTTAALLGPNGAGKSTTVAAIAGLLPIDRGQITVAGRLLDDPATGVFVPPEQRRVGVVFQDYLLFPHLTVRDNIAFGPACERRGWGVGHGQGRGERRGWGKREARRIADRWIRELDLTSFAHQRPTELSGGQAQRVALARALATEPDLLLLDEPMAALDVGARNQLRRSLAGYLDAYTGPRLLITHDPTDAFLLAEQVHVLEAGRLAQTGTPDEIRRRPTTPYVAALAGTNLLTGANDRGTITLDGLARTLRAADTHTNGPVLVTIHPTAIALHTEQPHGSPRNTWPTTVAIVEPLGETTRVTLADPLPLTADITPAAAAALHLAPGAPVWASVKATEIGLNPT